VGHPPSLTTPSIKQVVITAEKAGVRSGQYIEIPSPKRAALTTSNRVTTHSCSEAVNKIPSDFDEPTLAVDGLVAPSPVVKSEAKAQYYWFLSISLEAELDTRKFLQKFRPQMQWNQAAAEMFVSHWRQSDASN
jgi:hypothetical protein